MTSTHPSHLAALVCDAVTDLDEHYKAFEALELLIAGETSAGLKDQLRINREQLSGLFLVLNAAMRKRIVDLKAAADAAYEQQRHSGVHHAH